MSSCQVVFCFILLYNYYVYVVLEYSFSSKCSSKYDYDYNVDPKRHVILDIISVSCILFTAPGPPGDIVVSARSSSLLAVKWDGPSVRVKEYKVTLEGDSNTHPAQIIKDSKRKAIFNSLIAGTEYTVRVVTLGGDQQSATAQNKFYTSI